MLDLLLCESCATLGFLIVACVSSWLLLIVRFRCSQRILDSKSNTATRHMKFSCHCFGINRERHDISGGSRIMCAYNGILLQQYLHLP
jgi:hypothetical protein